MSKKINTKILLAEMKGRAQEFYPYFLGFYILSLLVSCFSKVWSSFFYWPAFHGAIIFFSLLFIATFKFSFKFKQDFIIGLVKNSSQRVQKQLRQYFNFIYTKLSKINRRSWLKIFIIAVIFIFSLIKQIGVIDFVILFYALISILFILDSRYAAGAALVFLAACPFLLIFKKDVIAENSAIFAYYFLVITVITQIRELKKEKNID